MWAASFLTIKQYMNDKATVLNHIRAVYLLSCTYFNILHRDAENVACSVLNFVKSKRLHYEQ